MPSLVFWVRYGSRAPGHVAIAATALALFDACLFFPLSWLEHTRSRQPSALLLLYFSVSLFFDIFQLKTLWINEYPPSIVGLGTACLCMKFVIAILESIEKFRFIAEEGKVYSPEDWSGLWNQGFCYWLNKLLWEGRHGHLSAEDLYPLSEDLSSQILDRNTVVSDSGLRGIGKALIESLGWSLLYPVLPRLLLAGLNISQPLLFKVILNYLQHVDGGWPAGMDSYIIVGIVVVYLGIAICTSIYWQLQQRNLTKIRGYLVCIVYRKVTEFPSHQTDTSAVTLMSTDVERVVQGLRNFHEAWANLIEVGLAIWLLERELQVASIAPVIVAIGELRQNPVTFALD